jgi:hypothetical protein
METYQYLHQTSGECLGVENYNYLPNTLKRARDIYSTGPSRNKQQSKLIYTTFCVCDLQCIKHYTCIFVWIHEDQYKSFVLVHQRVAVEIYRTHNRVHIRRTLSICTGIRIRSVFSKEIDEGDKYSSVILFVYG